MRGLIVIIALMVVGASALGAAAQDALDLSGDWRFRPDPDDAGPAQAWQSPDYSDADWAVLQAGTRWEEQGYPDLEGFGWYRRWVEVPETWQGRKVWLYLGAVNDACTIYCNGVRIHSYGDHTTRSVADTPVIAELSAMLRFGERNLLAIRVFDWEISGGLWRLPCMLTTKLADLPLDAIVSCCTEYEAHRLAVDVNLTGLGNELPETTLHITVRRNDDPEPLAHTVVPVPAETFRSFETFDLPAPQAGTRYHVLVAPMGPDGTPVSGITVSVDAVSYTHLTLPTN